MTILLKQIFSLLRLLNSENGAKPIALGLSLGFILGLSPWLSLQGIFIILLIVIFRVQAGAALLSAFFFRFVAYLLDPVFHKIGYMILKNKSWESFFTNLYNMPILPYTRFNNTVVMGSGIVGIILSPFVYFLFYFLVKKYKKTVVAKFEKTKFWKLLKATVIYKWYVSYEQFFG